MSLFGDSTALAVNAMLRARLERADEYITELRGELKAERDRYHALVERLAGLLEPKEAATPTFVHETVTASTIGRPPQIDAAIRKVANGDGRLSNHLWQWVNEPEQRARWHDPQGLPSLLDEIVNGKRARSA